MKHFSAFLRAVAASAAFAVAAHAPAYAQEQQQGEAPAAAAAAAVDAASDGIALDDSVRPSMPRLFFTNEQRRILEVVRQEFITEENLEFAEFAPLLIEQQETLDLDSEIGRLYDLRVDAFIRNRRSGAGLLWMNNEQYPLDDSSGVLGREGLDGLSFENSGEIAGTDSVNNSRFILRVGQKLAGDGEISETYPVIVVKKQ